MDRLVTFSDGSSLGLRATALTPRLYRHKMGRDLIVDLNNLKKSYEKVTKSQQEKEGNPRRDEISLSVTDLTIFENVAFIMARQYDPTLPSTAEEWLDSMDRVFTVYELLPDILELWQLNQHTTSVPQKK